MRSHPHLTRAWSGSSAGRRLERLVTRQSGCLWIDGFLPHSRESSSDLSKFADYHVGSLSLYDMGGKRLRWTLRNVANRLVVGSTSRSLTLDSHRTLHAIWTRRVGEMSYSDPVASATRQSSFGTLTLAGVLDDLAARFIVNLPPDELESMDRVCFQIEQACVLLSCAPCPLGPGLGGGMSSGAVASVPPRETRQVQRGRAGAGAVPARLPGEVPRAIYLRGPGITTRATPRLPFSHLPPPPSCGVRLQTQL